MECTPPRDVLRGGKNSGGGGNVFIMKGLGQDDRRGTGGGEGLSAWSDERLLAEYRDQGLRPAFEELVHRYEAELYNYLRSYLGDAEMAEDVFQQTFLQVHLKCDQFDSERRVRPWLYTVATNQAIDLRRRQGRHRAASLDRKLGSEGDEEAGLFVDLFSSSEPGPVEESEFSERRDDVRRAVAELPEQTRQVVQLVYFEGLKYREAADKLSIPVGTVKSRLHAAMHKLGETFAAHFEQHD